MAFITRTRFTLGCLFLMLMVSAAPGWGQSLNASLSGKVMDPSHASVPAALVTVQDTSTGVSQHYTTGPDGIYTFPNLLRGTYTLTVVAKGFEKYQQTGITIDLDAHVTANVTMVLGAQTLTVEVHANASPLNHENGAVAESVPPSTMEDLPLSVSGGQRNAASFVAMMPGITTSAETNVKSPRFAGGPAWGDDAVLDGGSMVEGLLNPSGMVALADYPLTPDGISEITVLTNNYDVQYGSSLGGVVTMETKSGTNQFHGDLFEYGRNTVLNANAWNSISAKPYDNEHEFGGTLGGPLHIPHLFWGGKHKTYFFELLDGYRISGGSGITTSTLPTMQERQGNFGDWVNSSGAVIPIFDPASTVANPAYNSSAKISATNEPYLRTQFPNNVIPTTYPNFAFAQKWIQYLPTNNVSGLANNYESPPIPSSYLSHNNESDTRVDEYIGSRDHFMASVRYSGQSAPKNAQQACVLPLPLCSDTENVPYYNFQDRLNWDHTFSPTVLNHFGASYSDFTQAKRTGDAPYAAQIPAIANVAANTYPPEITFADGYAQFGNTQGFAANDQTRRPARIFNDVLSWSKGKHLLKMGGETRFLELNGLNATNLSGLFGFTDALTGMPAVPTGFTATTTGNSFASFITGAAGSASSLFCYVCSYYSRSHQYSAFFGDTWKLSPKLTLSYGVRWDASTPLHEKNNDFSFFDPYISNPTAGNLLGTLAYAGSGWGAASFGRDSPGQFWLKGFGPRFGFAYDLGHNTVVRGGYGIFYGAQFYNQGGISQTGFSITVAPPAGPNSQSPAMWMQSSGSACVNSGLAASFCGFPTPPYYTPPPFVSQTYTNGKTPSAYSFTSDALPYVQQFTFTVEHSFSDNLFVTATYTGSKGTRLLADLGAYNVVNPSYLGTSLATQMTQTFGSTATSLDGVNVPYSGWWSQLETNATTCGNCTIAQALRPYPQFTGPMFPSNENDGNSFFNGFSFTVQKRTSHGLWFIADYNVQKNMGNFDDGGARGASPENLGNVSQYYRNRTWTVQTDDVPQTLKLSVVYDLPFAKFTSFGSHGFGRQVLDGWEVSTIYIANAGIPWQVYAGTCTNSALYGAPCVPGRLNGVSPYTMPESDYDPNWAAGSPRLIMNPLAFESQTLFTSGTYFGQGPLVDGQLRQPGYDNEDASLLKTFPIKERWKFQLRADFLDMWNWHSFTYTGSPNGGSKFTTNISSSSFGKWGGGLSGPRVIVMAGKLIW